MRRALLLSMLAGCATSGGPRPATPREIEAARPSLALLEAGNFVEARREAERLLLAQPENSRALVVQAVTRYQMAAHQLVSDLITVVSSAGRGGFNHKYMRTSLEDTNRELGAVDDALGRAANDPQIAVELCIACWRVDWNHNGRVDDRDQRLFEIEEDAEGNSIPDEDPRRRPRFRFDLGDLHWARAMVSFQRAMIEIILAYRWEELDQLLRRFDKSQSIAIHLGDKQRVARGRALILAGLDHADRSRRAILDEKDDDREWLPSPRQKSHPLPLPVDDALFVTWQGVTEDLRRLVRGDEGLSMREAAQLGGRLWQQPPGGFLDIGRLFADPRDISFDFAALALSRAQPEAALASVFGIAYVRTMKSSGLIARFARMKNEMDRGVESFGRKLRYLLWLN